MFKDENRHYSLRKLSVGLASVLIGISFASSMNSNSVKADTVKGDSNGVAETKNVTTSETNKVDANVDSSKEVAKSTNSVDSNKITPSQTVLNKQATSNDELLNGTEVKQEQVVEPKQETPGKQAPVNEQPTVSNKDANINLNSNLNKNYNKQALETSLLKDTNKPETTNTFHVRKLNIQANVNSLKESKAVDLNTNGGFDSSWGKLDVNDWKGSVQGDYYQLTDYTGDANHVIVPNEADFAKAGISTSGKQVGVTSDLMHTIFTDKTTVANATVAFSKTDNKQVKAINADWSNTWEHEYSYPRVALSKFDGANLDVSSVTNMTQMFEQNQIKDLSSLASWHTDNVTDMSSIFSGNQISDLSPLANWKVDNVVDMGNMFEQNQISDLSPLANWKVDNVVDMGNMFEQNQISDLGPLASWHTDNVKNMSNIFQNNQIKDLSPLANWKVDNVIGMVNMFEQNQISDLSPLASWHTDNVKDMSNIFQNNQIKDLSPLANWKVDNVIGMGNMFEQNQISDLSPLANWKVDNVTDMREMFEQNQIGDLSPLANWKVDNVGSMAFMFEQNQISDLSPLTNWNVNNVGEMFGMFAQNQISDLSPLANWKVDNVQMMGSMFYDNQISDLSPLANWKVDNARDMSQMFYGNHISDLRPLANWNVNNAAYMYRMFDNNSLIITQAKRVINFVYPEGYTGKKQDSVTQTVNLPQKVKIELTTKDSKPSNNILDWVTKTETPETPESVYFQDYTVPEIKGLLEPDQTVISREQADITKPINVTVTYKLVESNTNDAFALDSKHGLHEHINVNDNGGYDADFWGKINVDDWNYSVNGDIISISGLKDGVSTGANDAVIVPNLYDFKLAGKDGGAKTVYISNDALGINSKYKYYGLSKTNGNTFATNSDLSLVFYKNNNLTHADLNSLNTSNTTNMNYMFSNTKSLTNLDVSNWDTGKATTMTAMFIGASSLTNLDASHWDTSNVTNMGRMFTNASRLTNLDVSHWDTSKVTDMHAMFYNANSLTNLDVSHWDTSKVTNMRYMFDGAHNLTNLNVSDWDTSKVTNMRDMFNGAGSLALIVNGDKFADYLVKNNFADSGINSGVKSVTTDNAKLLQLLTNDSQHNSATRTIVFTFPANYSPDLTKYHLTKTGNTYQIKQSIDYDKLYLQGTVLINATDDITAHHIDITKPYRLSDTWQPNYDKLVLAHKNSDGSVSFDAIQLPKVPGYKTAVKTVASPINPARALFAVSFMALSKSVTPAINDVKPAKTVTPATPVAIEVAKPIKTEPKVATAFKVIDLSDDAVSTTPKETTWQVADEPDQDTYQVSNGKYTVELPHISNAQLHVIANDSTKDSVLFTYKGQNTKYVFNIKFVNGHYLLTTYEIKSDKLVKLIDYNFIKSSKMIDTILDWLKLK